MKNLDLTTDQKIKIANIKQELLSPAEIIYSYSELLLQNFKNKNLKDEISDCENIITASNNLMQLVSDLLNPENKNFNSNDSLKEIETKIRHDLRTPINAIRGYSEILLEDLSELNDKQIFQDLKFIIKASNDFLEKIGNIIDFSTTKIDSAKDTFFNKKILKDL